MSGIDLPAMPVRVAAQITGDTDKSLSFKKLDAGFGGSSITGEASVTFGGDRTKLVARVQSPLLDLTEFAGKRTPPAKAPNDGRLFSDKPLPVQALGLADADISLDVAQVRTEAGPLDQFKLRLTLNNRLLELKPVARNISGGKFIASLLVSGRQEPATVKLDLSSQQLNVGPLLKQAIGKNAI